MFLYQTPFFSPDYSSSPSSLHVCFLSHRNHCHLRPTDTSVVFCPVIWHIFDVESKKKKKKTKWETARERGNNLRSPLQWKALFVEHSCVNPQYCHHHHHPPFPPLLLPCLLLSSLLSKAWVDFSLNAIRKVTGPIHGQMEGWLSVWRPIPSVENDRNPSCRWRSVWTEQTDFIGADRGENKWKEDCITYLLFISSSHCYFLCEQEPPFPILNSFNIFLWTQVFLHPFSTTHIFLCLQWKKLPRTTICCSGGQPGVFSGCSVTPPSKTSLSLFKKKELLKELRALLWNKTTYCATVSADKQGERIHALFMSHQREEINLSYCLAPVDYVTGQ